MPDETEQQKADRELKEALDTYDETMRLTAEYDRAIAEARKWSQENPDAPGALK